MAHRETRLLTATRNAIYDRLSPAAGGSMTNGTYLVSLAWSLERQSTPEAVAWFAGTRETELVLSLVGAVGDVL